MSAGQTPILRSEIAEGLDRCSKTNATEHSGDKIPGLRRPEAVRVGISSIHAECGVGEHGPGLNRGCDIG